MRIQARKAETPMRTDDIVIQYTHAHTRTEGMYFPKKKSLAAMTLEEARRGLCPRSGGDSRVCRSDCPAPCRIGRWVISLEDAARIPSRHVAVMAQR